MQTWTSAMCRWAVAALVVATGCGDGDEGSARGDAAAGEGDAGTEMDAAAGHDGGRDDADGSPNDSGASGGDGSDPDFQFECAAFERPLSPEVHAADLQIVEAGDTWPGTVGASSSWTTVANADVLRVWLQLSQDPVPGAVDDELHYVLTLDLDPTAALASDGSTYAVDQMLAAPDSVTRGPNDSGIGSVSFEMGCFCAPDDQWGYHVTGTLALQHDGDGRFRGTLALAVAGDIRNLGTKDLEVGGCFDVKPEPASK